jgi:TRAP-type C4-dicarboxylate transport system substrate-binding protein
MKLKLFTLFMSILMAGTALAKEDKVIVRLGTVAPEGTPWERALKKTRKRFKKMSAGKIKMKTFFGGQKGDEKSMIRQIKDGRLELFGGSTAALATEVPDLQVLELPFLFASNAEADFILDNYLYEPVKKIIDQYGFVLYQWAENGWQNFGMKEGFIKTPADLKGRKMRSQESPIHIATWKSMGASPIEMAVSEVLPALNTGLVDGFAQTPLFTFAAGWHQGIKNYTISRHVYQPGVIIYSKKWFSKQTKDIQTVLMSNIEADTKNGRKGVRQIEPGLVQNFVNYGINVYTLTPEERAVFEKIAEQTHKAYLKRATKGAKQLYKAIQAGKKAFKAKNS